MEAWPSDQETLVAAGKPLPPWAAAAAAAAWEEPGDITRQVSAAGLEASSIIPNERSHVSVKGQTSTWRFTCARGGAAAATGRTCCSSCCIGSNRPFWVSSSGGSSIFRVLVHSGRNKPEQSLASIDEIWE